MSVFLFDNMSICYFLFAQRKMKVESRGASLIIMLLFYRFESHDVYIGFLSEPAVVYWCRSTPFYQAANLGIYSSHRFKLLRFVGSVVVFFSIV